MRKLLVAPLRLGGIILGSLLMAGLLLTAITLLFMFGESQKGAPRTDAVFLRLRDAAMWLIKGPARYRGSNHQNSQAGIRIVSAPAPYPVPR